VQSHESLIPAINTSHGAKIDEHNGDSGQERVSWCARARGSSAKQS